MNCHRAALWTSRSLFRTIAFSVAILLASSGIAMACNVPVFRYAIERWSPDRYRVVVFHRGSLDEAQRLRLASLSQTPTGNEQSAGNERPTGKESANIEFRPVNIDAIKDDADRALLASQKPTAFPWLVVQYPGGLKNDTPISSGPLTEDAVSHLVGSPLRTELVRRLASGQTAVWLMLESGHPDKDDATAAKLADELSKLADRLKLPELTGSPEDEMLSDVPLQIKFSVLRVPRGAANDPALVEMLLHSESDLVEFDEPIVYPVFGRGRALLPLVGAGITTENIHESAAFLVGACSCEVKERNPGFDLLLSANWNTLFSGPAGLSNIAGPESTKPSGVTELVAIPAGSPPTASVSQPASVSQSASVSPQAASVSPSWVESNRATLMVMGALLAVGLCAVFKRLATSHVERKAH
jgi:hypothetical protein